MGGGAGLIGGRPATAAGPDGSPEVPSGDGYVIPGTDDLLYQGLEPPLPPPEPPAAPAPQGVTPIEPPAVAGTKPWTSVGPSDPTDGAVVATSILGDAELFRATGPQSFMRDQTLISVYGRSFGVAPILGMLGQLESFDELERVVEPWTTGVREVTNGQRVVVAPHLLYALARPCQEAGDSCLIFLDASGVDIVGEYVEPALERDMAVILDAQIGRSSPEYIVRRMIDAGFLAYPNVHVALDPEFATLRGQVTPGDPIGQLHADQINSIQELLAGYVRDDNLPFKKVLIVHQVIDALTDSWTMIPAKQEIEEFAEVEVIINADGFGSPDAKVYKYNAVTDRQAYPGLRWRGFKIFHYNPYAPRFSDTPVMTPRQVFGLDPTSAGWRMWAPPHLLVLA